MTRFFDGIYPRTKKAKSKRNLFFALILIPIFLSFFYVGVAGADFVLPKINLLKLFQNGRYLILFQNNAELRSSGGFIGSYAVLETQNFEVKNIAFNTNIYATDHAFADKYYVEAPPVVKKMLDGQSWALRDSNYAASFSEAAETIKFFYEKETGQKIDGIVALNAKVVVDLLKISGPVKIASSDTTLTAQNFYELTQSQIEQVYYQHPENWVMNEPKSFLKVIYPAILTQALKNKPELIKTLKNNLDTKEILFYFADSNKEHLISQYQLDGAMPDNQELGRDDYLYINSNSYSANKSSLSIHDSLNYQVTTLDEGKSEVKLTLNRLHAGTDSWPDGKNYEWMRIFVAPGAEFQKATLNGQYLEVEPGEESGRNYYGFYITTEPGAANIIELSYTIPTQNDYHLLIQKQPGKSDIPLTVTRDGQVLYLGTLDKDIKIQ